MKTFWCSLVVFLLLLGAITVNFFYVNRTADELLRLTDAVPDDPQQAAQALNELSDYWGSHRDLLGMSVNYPELNHVGELIVSMDINREEGETAEFLRCRALLSPAIDEVRRLEQFKVWNIF